MRTDIGEAAGDEKVQMMSKDVWIPAPCLRRDRLGWNDVPSGCGEYKVGGSGIRDFGWRKGASRSELG